MAAPLVWTEPRDAVLVRLRQAGLSWDSIAGKLGISRWSVVERGRLIGAYKPPRPRPIATLLDLGREPLPAGHPTTWGAITAGTEEAGTRYPFPPLPPLSNAAFKALCEAQVRA